jgi:uncharacterized protein
VNAAAETFRPNPKLDTAKVITELGKGEALVSFLEGNGTPSMVERTMVRPPSARIGPVTPEERKAIIGKSPVKGKYDHTIDSESAYEVLQKRVHGAPLSQAPAPAPTGPWTPTAGAPAPLPGGTEAPSSGGFGGMLSGVGAVLGSIFGTSRPRGTRLSTGQVIAREVTRSVTTRVAGKIAADFGKSIGGSMGGSVGRAIVRGTLGGILRR